jgi:hypothetical protein|tara:strand:+ start:229 stop:357 length:129 start_codon:yes stop_codon:yes gene_type:complete
MPAFVKSRLGEVGIKDAEAIAVCDFFSKKSIKELLIASEFME